MARQEKQSYQLKAQQDTHQRQLRRNQIIFGVLSIFLILSMLLTLLK